MYKRLRKGLLLLAASLLAVVVIILCGAVALNLTPLEKSIARLVERSTGLVVSFSGPLHLRFGLHPHVQAVGLELMAGDGSDYFLRIASLELQLQLGKLLAGELSFDEVDFSGLILDACLPAPVLPRSEDSDNSPGLSLSLHHIDGRDIEIRCTGGSAYFPVQLGKIGGTAIKGEDLALAADVRWRGSEFGLDLAGAPLDKLLYSDQPQPLMVSATTEFANLELEATIEDLLEEPGIQANVSARLDRPDTLLALLDIPAEGLPAISIQGHIGQAGEQLSVDSLSGYFGQAVWSLSGSIDWSEQRPLLVLDAQLDQLDIDTLLRSLPPSTEKSRDPADVYRELPLQLLDMADARIDLRLTRLIAQPAPPADLVLRVELEAGQPHIDILKFHTGSGDAFGRITLDRNSICPAWLASVTSSGLDLRAMGKLSGLGEPLLGTLETGEAIFTACGTTVQAIRESLAVTASITALQIQPSPGLPLVEIEVATLTSGWHRPTQLDAKLLLDDQSLDGRFAAGAIARLLEGPDWPVQVKLAATDAELGINGVVRVVGKQASAAADVTFRASRPGPILSLAGFDPGYRGRIALDLHADLDEKVISINGLKLALGNSDVEGSLQLALADRDQMSDLVLRSRVVDFGELQQIFASQDNASPTRSGSLDFEWPTLRLDLAVDEMHGFERDITNCSLNGSLREKRIERARLALEVAEFALLGQLDADFSAAIPGVSIDTIMRDIDLGAVIRTLELAPNVDIRAGEMQIHLASSGSEWQELAHNLELDFALRQLQWNLPERWPGDDFQLKIHDIVGKARPEIPVSLTLVGELDKFPVNGWLQLASVHQLLDPLAPLPLRVVLGTDRETVMLNVTMERDYGTGLEATVQLSAMEKVFALPEFGELDGPLPGLVIDAEIDLGQDELQTIELAAAVGGSTLEGSLVARQEAGKNRFEIALNSPHLQTTDFSPLVAALGKEEAATQPAAAGEAIPSGFLEVLEDYLQRVPEKYDFDIEASINELVAGEHFLGAAEFRTSVRQQNIEWGNLKLSSPRGDVEVNYSLDHTARGLHSTLDAHMAGFEVGSLLTTLDPNSSAGGLLYVDTRLEAIAPGLQEMPRTVRGHLDLALFPRDISADVLDLWASNLIFALVPKTDGGHKQINCLVSRFEIEDGIMHSKNILLDSTEVIVRGKGDINLGERELDLIFAPQAKRERFLSVSSPISVAGSFDDFKLGMAGTGWVGTLFRWYLSLIYVPWKWLTGENFPADGKETCLRAMEWQADIKNLAVMSE